MAHSFVDYRGRHVRMHDVELVVALLLLDAALTRGDGTGAAPVLQRIVRSWLGCLDEWGPGCIDLALDTTLGHAVQVDAMGALIDAAHEELRSLGDEVPATYINGRLGLSGNRALRSVSATTIREALGQLASLVAVDTNDPGSGGVAEVMSLSTS